MSPKLIVQPRIPNAATPVGARRTTGSYVMSPPLEKSSLRAVVIAHIKNYFPIPAVPSTLIHRGAGLSSSPGFSFYNKPSLAKINFADRLSTSANPLQAVPGYYHWGLFCFLR